MKAKLSNGTQLSSSGKATKPRNGGKPKKHPARKVAHAQLSDPEQRYKQLCKSIPEHGEKCLRHRNTLMSEMWAMAEEVHELKAVCQSLGKPYEADAIRLCKGETAFHYLRDLYTAFAGNKQQALECAKAPYTLLRDFRKERAAKNKDEKGESAQTKADDDDAKQGIAAKIGRKEKDAANKGKKTSPAIAEDVGAANKEAEEASPIDDEASANNDQLSLVIDDEEDEGFDSGELFDEFATRNNWDNQRQVQAMVDFFGTDALGVLLSEVAEEAEFKEFLAEQEKLPPPKENGDWPLGILVKVRNRLEHLLPEMKTVDWAKEPATDYRERLDEIAAAVEELRKEVPQ